MQARISDIIRQYSEQGIHRTGTAVDQQNAAWLCREIRALGVAATTSEFEFQRLEPLNTFLQIDDKTIHGVPLYDCCYTDPQGIRGKLGELNSNAEIGIAMSLPHSATPNAQAIYTARKAAKHKAIVIVTDERLPNDGIALLNAEDFSAPFGPPVLQVASKDWPQLQQAMNAGTKGTLVLDCRYVTAEAINVTAKIEGSNPELAPLVVMTPRSGWWYNASERGGGIACFLEIMRALKTSGAQRDIIFTANTGHELGHTGLAFFLRQHPALIQQAHLWIHLGANFAAKFGSQVRLQYSDDTAAASFKPILEANHLSPATQTPIGERPLGEARDIFDGHGRYISILGGNELFHHPADQWPEAVDIELTTRWSRALATLAVSLATQ